MVTVLAALIALCVVVGGLVAWNVWGPREVPAINATSAGDVASQLEGRGFKVIRRKQYDGARKGSYVGLEGAKSGDRLAAGSTVTVVESMGPGVPEGTVGQSVQQAEQTLKPMGVTLTEHEVVSLKPGHVSVTRPADGDPVTDPDAGIDLGVGVEGDGIPVEIAGMNQDEAQSQLESMGYTVTLEPRFSSRKYLGRIVGANPGIGVKSDVKDVTLYYGVDASKRYDVLDGKSPYVEGEEIAHLDRLAGRYCTAGGDCITLDAVSQYGRTNGYWLGMDGKGVSNYLNDALDMCPYSQSLRCAPANRPGMQSAKEETVNHLISGDTGAFELYRGYGLPVCGDVNMGGSPGNYCDNGTVASGVQTSTGLKYKAEDFLVYMPVDAKLADLESSGYFDGKSDFKPDGDRVYLIRRDDTKYQPQDLGSGFAASPFVPTKDHKPVAFKDAPNAKNVYYLEEDPIDWTLLDGSVVSEGDSGKSSSSDKADYTPFAADYMLSSGAGAWYSELKIDKDGSFTGHYKDGNAGDVGDEYPKGTTEVADFSGRFKSITRNGDGSYTLECDADSFKLAGTPGQSTIKDGMRYHNADAESTGMAPCGTFTGYPVGASVDAIRNKAGHPVMGLPESGTSDRRVLFNDGKPNVIPFVESVQN